MARLPCFIYSRMRTRMKDGRFISAILLVLQPESKIERAQLEVLFRAGFLTPVNGDPERYSFVAPLIRNSLVLRLGRRAAVIPTRLHQLVFRAIGGMSSQSLAATGTKHNEASFSTVRTHRAHPSGCVLMISC